MINSMTGYGEAEGQFDSVTYTVEIRTVNSRYFKSRLKLPDAMAFLEQDIEQLLRRELSRGTVNYVLGLKNISSESLFDIDEVVLRRIMERLAEVASSVKVPSRIDMANLLHLPGIVRSKLPDKHKAEQLKDFVLDITQKALERLKQMRAAEGKALAADLDVHCQAMRKDIENILAIQAETGAEYAKKLKKRIDELLTEAKVELDKETLAREVAIFVDRTDISEEIARLRSHLSQFTESCNGDGQAGRRLDFLSQEMLREANTIASKAFDVKIIHWVLDLKCRIDRIKEQVQNVE